ncbi:hypothetical protein [Nocardia sp. NPDC051570]|uniref:hypothetical protein n=1 Tax=Nocardia sp. NPDC051570 TaxID=3364324 RepID=UPI003791D855
MPHFVLDRERANDWHLRRQEIRLTDPQIVGDLINHACVVISDVQDAVVACRNGLIVAAAGIVVGENFMNLATHGRL